MVRVYKCISAFPTFADGGSSCLGIDLGLAVPRRLYPRMTWHGNWDRPEPYIHIIYCITTVHPKILMGVYTSTYIHMVCTVYTVSFHSIQPSRVTGLVAMAEIGCLSCVTG
jgi:hypothetical protein